MAPHAAVYRQQWAVGEKIEQFFFSEWHSVVELLIRVTRSTMSLDQYQDLHFLPYPLVKFWENCGIS